jgi:mRNA interferase MazF
MPSYSRGDVILVRYPFSDLSGSKVRPAVVVNGVHESRDVFVMALTSQIKNLQSGEFVLSDFHVAGLNVPSAAKRALYTVEEPLVLKRLGALSASDTVGVDKALAYWFGLGLST